MMQFKGNSKANPRKKKTTWVSAVVLALIAVLILLVVFVVPAYVSSEKGRKMVLKKINSAVDGQANFTNLSMGWFDGIKVTDISFSDSAGKMSVAVKELATKPHYVSILLGGLSFGRTIIAEPRVEINLAAQQTKTGADSGGKVGGVERSGRLVLPIDKIDLVITDGSLKVTPEAGREVEVSQINSKVNLNPLGQRTDFSINMAVVDAAGQSQIRVGGQIKPGKRTGWNLKGTSGEFVIEVNELDLASLGPIFVLAGIEIEAKGAVSANIDTKVEKGRIETLKAEVAGSGLDVASPQLQGDSFRTKKLDASIDLHGEKGLMVVDKLKVDTDWLDAEAQGSLPTSYEAFADFMKPEAPYSFNGTFDLDVAMLVSQMPRTFGVVKGTSITSGKLTGSVETVTADGKRGIFARGSLAGLAGETGGRRAVLSEPITAAVQLSSDEAGIKFDKVNAKASFASVNLTGNTEKFRYTGQVDLGKLQAELGQFVDIGGYRMSGQVSEEGQIAITKDSIAASGSAMARDVRLTSAEGISVAEPQAAISYSAAVDRKKSVVNIESVALDATVGQLNVTDAVVPYGEKAKEAMRLNVLARQINLKNVQPFAVLFAGFPKEMQMSGVAESDVSINRRATALLIKTDSTKIKDFKLLYPNTNPFEQEEVSLVFDGEFDVDNQSWNIKKLDLASPQIKIHRKQLQKTIEGGQARLRGEIDAEYDWSAVSTVAAGFMPKGLTLKGKRKDTISFSSDYPIDDSNKLMANLNTKASVGFEKADFKGIEVGATEVKVEVKKGVMTVGPFSAIVNQGQLNFAGGADFNKKPTLLRLPQPMHIAKDIPITENMSNQLLAYVNPIFSNIVSPTGVVNFNCEKLAIPVRDAGINDLEVVGTFSYAGRMVPTGLLGTIMSLMGESERSQDVTVYPTKFIIRNGHMQYADEMQIAIGDKPVSFTGGLWLDERLDNMAVTLPVTYSGKTVRIGRETGGRRVTLPLKGTVRKPEIDTSKLAEEAIKGLLEEELRKGLEGLFK